MTFNHTIGTTVHFGPHALLPPDCLQLLFRLLRCKNCHFRTLYHRSSVEDMHATNLAIKIDQKPRNSPFHSLLRAMKVVLHAFQPDEKDSKSFIIQARSEASVSHLHSHPNYHLKAIVHTTLLVQGKPPVCPIHRDELLSIFYPLDDDGNGTLCISSSIDSLIMRGQSEFFRSVSSIESNCVPSRESCHCTGLSGSTPEMCGDLLKMNLYKPSDGIRFYAAITGTHLEDPVVLDANRRWKSSYGCDCVKHPFPETSEVPQNDTNRQKRHVHFPDNNPVTSVHILRTYATACQLERRDRTWLFEATRRFFDQCKQLSPGVENEEDLDIVEQPDLQSVNAKISAPITDVDDTITNVVVNSKPKRRKRRRRHGSLRLLYCATTPRIPVDCDIKLMYLSNPDPQSCTVFISEPSN